MLLTEVLSYMSTTKYTKPKLLLICSTTGSGKDFLVKPYLSIKNAIIYTTRKKRDDDPKNIIHLSKQEWFSTYQNANSSETFVPTLFNENLYFSKPPSDYNPLEDVLFIAAEESTIYELISANMYNYDICLVIGYYKDFNIERYYGFPKHVQARRTYKFIEDENERNKILSRKINEIPYSHAKKIIVNEVNHNEFLGSSPSVISDIEEWISK